MGDFSEVLYNLRQSELRKRAQYDSGEGVEHTRCQSASALLTYFIYEKGAGDYRQYPGHLKYFGEERLLEGFAEGGGHEIGLAGDTEPGNADKRKSVEVALRELPDFGSLKHEYKNSSRLIYVYKRTRVAKTG